MEISIIRFKREEESYWESGLEVRSHKNIIIDSQGNVLNEVYDIRDTSDFILNITPYLENK